MKVSLPWLHELVDLKASDQDLIDLLPKKTIGLKEVADNFIELDMKGYNRADLLSLRGVAFETAAITDSEVKFSEEDFKPDPNLAKLSVQVEDQKLCPVYCLVKIEGLKVEKSPESWVKKLEESGMRSVNNVADVTNLVMLEFGQPMHAFDATTVKDENIIVRIARDGEELETLDGKKRKLQQSELLITDPEKALGIAGVMGGKNSEITDSTTIILLESAIFDPKNLRKTANRLGLVSEAGKRFYHGLTKKRLYQALKRAIELYESLGGKVTAASFEDSLEEKVKKIELTKKKVDSLIGVDISEDEIENYLKKLRFELEKKGEGVWEITVPYFRLDIEIEEDLVEEVARMYGYDKIPSKELVGEIPEKIDQKQFDPIYNLKKSLVEEGLTEVQTYSFYSTDILNNLSWDKSQLVKISNPISAETEYLRKNLWQNLLEVVVKNYKKGFEDIAIFELGKVYSPKESSDPEEDYHLSITLMNDTENPIEELYAIFEKLNQDLNLNISLGQELNDECKSSNFHPTRVRCLDFQGKPLGFIAEVHPRIVNKFGLDKRVAVLEINLKELL